MAACNALTMAPTPAEDCEDCVQVVKTTKRVRVPCHRNTFKQYTVKVPRSVTKQVPRSVHYTVNETRHKQVPYTTTRTEQRVRIENQCYQHPVTVTKTKMVNVTRKVPRTIYVDVTTQVPKTYQETNMESRTRQVKIPYTVQVPETKYKNETYVVKVPKTKTVIDNVTETVYDTQVRTRCEPKVTYVTKEIPVYNVVARPAQPCPPDQPCGTGNGNLDELNLTNPGGIPHVPAPPVPVPVPGPIVPVPTIPVGGVPGGIREPVRPNPVSRALAQEFNSLDKNNDGVLSHQEYVAARTPPGMFSGGDADAGTGTTMGGTMAPQM